jgi:uncharacterized protein YcbX
MSICELTRFPLKSARGERLGAVDVEADGLRGDRIWACLDAVDGTVGSAKHPRRWQRLLGVSTRLDGDTLALGVDGRTVLAGTAEADTALSAYLGREVRLSRVVPPDARLHRLMPDQPGMLPDWADAEPGAETVDAIAGARDGRFVDFGAVHLVTTGALVALGERLGRGTVAGMRFRPNILVDAPREFVPGERLRVGGVVLRVSMPTPRCVVPGLAQEHLPADRELLGVLARHYRVPVDGYGRAACFGTYADVLRPGLIRVGDRVTCQPA